MASRLYENSCKDIEMPILKEKLVVTAAKVGMEWDIEDVLNEPSLL